MRRGGAGATSTATFAIPGGAPAGGAVGDDGGDTSINVGSTSIPCGGASASPGASFTATGAVPGGAPAGNVTAAKGNVGGDPPVEFKRDPPPLLQYDDLPPRSVELLRAASAEIFGIQTPRPFQCTVAHHCICNDDTVLVVPRRTADGKTLVAQLSVFFRGGIILYEEPLVGLATDQVERATATEHNIEGYHGDEHKNADQRLLIDRLLSFNSDGAEANHVVINLMIGPKLTTSKTWRPVLETLAKRGLIQMIVIDEVHYIRQSASFRPEFREMISFLA